MSRWNCNNKKRINIEVAERVAEILFEKISSKKIGTHLVWVNYKYSSNNECDIVKAIDEEFLIFPNESDPLVRKSKKLDFLGKENKHTILFIKRKKYDEAIICYGRAKEINQKIFSDNHISIAICNDKLCYAYSLLDNNKKALEHSQKALKVMKKVFTKKHPNISDAYFHLAVVYKNLEKYEKAFTYFYKAYLIDFELFGKMHQRTQIKGKYLEEQFKKIYPDKDFQKWLEEKS